MNDVNLNGAKLKLAEPGTHIPKGTAILVETGDTHSQVYPLPDPTYTVTFTLNSADSGPIVSSGLSNTAVDDIVQTFEEGHGVIWVRTGDKTEHVISTDIIQLIKITEEYKA